MEKARTPSGKVSRLRVPTLSFVLLAALILITCCVSLITCFALTLPGKRTSHSLISLACRFSSSPQACKSSLSLGPDAITPLCFVFNAISLARERLQLCQAIVQAFLPSRSQDPNLERAVYNCEYLLRRALHVVDICTVYIMEDNEAMSCSANAENSRGAPAIINKSVYGTSKIKDMEAWLSAALTWENDCYSALGYVNVSAVISQNDVLQDGSTMIQGVKYSFHDSVRYYTVNTNHRLSHRSPYATYFSNHANQDGNGAQDLVNYLMQHVSTATMLTSNALSMLDAYDTYGPNVSAWSPPSKQSLPGIQQQSDQRDWDAGNIKGLVPTVIVSKDGLGAYSKIQDAVDDAPENASKRFVIYIKQGVYNETVRVPYTKPFLAFVGDGMGKTIITGNLNAQMPGVSTYDTATVAVDGDGFLAYNLTVENTAHPDLHQAVALRVSSDLSAFFNCSFLGHQDTLYAHSLRHFYQNCRIEGTLDFIFGNAASIFQNCEVLIRPGRIFSSIVTAHGRTDPAQTTGFVFDGCIINGTEEFMGMFALNPKKYRVYLGRPWKSYARTLYKSCLLERLVRPEGWRPWKGDFALDTLFYGEYDNSGKGSNATGRVKWSEQVSGSLAMLYTVPNFIQGDNWLSSTNIKHHSRSSSVTVPRL